MKNIMLMSSSRIFIGITIVIVDFTMLIVRASIMTAASTAYACYSRSKY